MRISVFYWVNIRLHFYCSLILTNAFKCINQNYQELIRQKLKEHIVNTFTFNGQLSLILSNIFMCINEN